MRAVTCGQRVEKAMRPTVLAIAWMALAAASGVRAGGREWARFRGPNGTGISDATTVPVTWTAKDYNWTVTLPGVGHSSPVLWGGRLFVTSGEKATAKRLVLCLDAATGKTLWRREFPSKTHRQHRDNSYGSITPAADADGLVLAWGTPEQVLLLALDLDGREIWRRDLGPYVGDHGAGTSPIIAGGLVVLANDQEDPKAIPSMYGPNTTRPPGKSFLIAVDRKTGETRWTVSRRTRLSAYSTPCVSRSLEGRPELIFTSTAHGITGVDLATGMVTWELNGVFRDRCVGSPALGAGLVMASYGAGTQGARLVAVRPGSRPKGIEPKLVWELKRPVPLVPTPLVKDGLAFLWGDDGRVSCVRAATGEVVWRQRVKGSFYGSPVWVAGRLYSISKRGEVVVLAAAERFQQLARVPLGEPSFATPAVAGGVMYLRTRSHLFSLGGGS